MTLSPYRLGSLAAVALLAAACAAPTPAPSGVVAPSPAGVPSAASPPAAPTPVLTPPPGAGSDPSPSPSPVRAPALEGRLTCGAPDNEFPQEALDRPAGAELGLDPAAAALRTYLERSVQAGAPVPRTGWRAVIEEPQHVVYLAPDGEGWVMASFILGDDGTWMDWDQGQCRLRVVLPEGIGFAEWRLDPTRLPRPEATTLHLLATETACAGGKPPLGRMLAPIVLDTDGAVTIVLEVRSRPGDQDCQGNPEVPIEVELAAPRGGRSLYDGSTVPPTLRHPGDPAAPPSG